LPLIVISHGNIGTFADHHDTAEALADAGFIVASISHRGDNTVNFNDGADPSVMIERPLDIKRLLSYMIAVSPAAPHLNPRRIGFFGWSAGGYTGLVLAGAKPDWDAVICRFSLAARTCADVLSKEFTAHSHASDPRIRAAVLADPPAGWFGRASFRSVTIPIQLWASETGGRGLPGILPDFGVFKINRNLPKFHEYHVVQGSGHFAFELCNSLISTIPAFCTDAPGFDRAAFHKQFNAEVIRFFKSKLSRDAMQDREKPHKQLG
jgi:predicted dienelactone hydrolase